MLETSKDLFYVALAFAIFWLTVFICWAVYQLTMILRNVNRMSFSIREKIELIDEILKLIKEKIEKSSSYLSLLADSAIKLVGFFIEKQKKQKKKTK